MSKKVLITGCNGFIGRHISRFFASRQYDVCGIDIAGEPEPCVGKFIQGHITNEALVQLGEPFDCIIHLAGPGTVHAANLNADAIHETVLSNIRSILESTRRYPETLFLFPSSAAVYGNQRQSPIAEDFAYSPLSNYGRNKVAEETLCAEYHKTYGSRICMIRFFSIYGPGLRKQLLWDFSQRLATALKEGKASVPCFGTGEETRDYIYIDDVVRVFEFFCEKNPDWLIVNAGMGKATSVRQVLMSLVEEYGVSTALDFDGVIRVDNPTHLIADVHKLEEMGFRSTVPFADGIRRYAAWAAKELSI